MPASSATGRATASAWTIAPARSRIKATRPEYCVPMVPPIDRLIETLTEARAKLEEELGRVEAYRALRQLAQREASGEHLSIVPGDRLREKLEAELAGNHYLNARRKLDEALTLLGAWDTSQSVAELNSPTPQTELPAKASTAAANGAPEVLGPIPANLPPDDLSLIRDLPSACISVVTAAGFGRYTSLAGIDANGVAMLERLLGQKGIVARGNWIEQAAMLAAGRQTRYAQKLIARRSSAPSPQKPQMLPPVEIGAPVVDEAMPEIVALPTPPDPRFAKPHDLTHIAGIDAEMARRLGGLGVVRFEAIAGWTARDLDAIAPSLDINCSRIASEGWIEQAAMLAASSPTHYLDAKPLQVPVAALPPQLDIPAELDELPIEIVLDLPEPEPILVDWPANDDPSPTAARFPAEAPPASSFGSAVSGKAVLFKPPRRLSDRTDSAFDDVAALVARTVATARNVGGMSEQAKRPTPPASEKPKADVPFRAAPAAPRIVPEPSRQQASIEVSVRPAAPPPLAAATAPPLGNVMSAVGMDAEASIEIRPRITGAPKGVVVPKARELSIPPKAREMNALPNVDRTDATAKSGSDGSPANGATTESRIVRRSPGTPRVPLVSNAARPAANGSARQTIVIDELAGSRRGSNGHAAGTVVEPDLQRGRFGSLVGRFVKALRGEKAS
jgi:predicted flap endonuclease-1-like 5' DNA nuclease